jgi:hypothetical protein
MSEITPESYYADAELYAKRARAALAVTEDVHRQTDFQIRQAGTEFIRNARMAELSLRMAETGLAFEQPSGLLAASPGEPLGVQRRYSAIAVPTLVTEMENSENLTGSKVWAVRVEHPRWGMPHTHISALPERPVFHAVKFTQGIMEGVELRTLDGAKLTERVWAL